MSSSSNENNVQNDEDVTEEENRPSDMSSQAHDNIQGKYIGQSIRKRPKSKAKVTKLLEKSLKKYQYIDKVGSTQEPKVSPPNNKVGALKRGKQNGKKLGKRIVTCKRFSEEEDEIIVEAFASAGISELKKVPTGFLSDLK